MGKRKWDGIAPEFGMLTRLNDCHSTVAEIKLSNTRYFCDYRDAPLQIHKVVLSPQDDLNIIQRTSAFAAVCEEVVNIKADSFQSAVAK